MSEFAITILRIPIHPIYTRTSHITSTLEPHEYRVYPRRKCPSTQCLIPMPFPSQSFRITRNIPDIVLLTSHYCPSNLKLLLIEVLYICSWADSSYTIHVPSKYSGEKPFSYLLEYTDMWPYFSAVMTVLIISLHRISWVSLHLLQCKYE